MQKFPGQLRKGDVIVSVEGEFPVLKVEPVFGGSWFNVTVKGINEPVPFGHSEKVEVKV